MIREDSSRATLCNGFQERRPQSTLNGLEARKPTPIF
jgi:hypothetical protein